MKGCFGILFVLGVGLLVFIASGCATLPAIATDAAVDVAAAPLGIQTVENYATCHQARGWRLGWTWRF